MSQHGTPTWPRPLLQPASRMTVRKYADQTAKHVRLAIQCLLGLLACLSQSVRRHCRSFVLSLGLFRMGNSRLLAPSPCRCHFCLVGDVCPGDAWEIPYDGKPPNRKADPPRDSGFRLEQGGDRAVGSSDRVRD